jgi:hypothetical protein
MADCLKSRTTKRFENIEENICRKVQNREPCGFLLHLILFLNFAPIYCNLPQCDTAYKMNSQRVKLT